MKQKFFGGNGKQKPKQGQNDNRGDNRKQQFAKAVGEVNQALKAGKITREQANERLGALKQKFFGGSEKQKPRERSDKQKTLGPSPSKKGPVKSPPKPTKTKPTKTKPTKTKPTKTKPTKPAKNTPSKSETS